MLSPPFGAAKGRVGRGALALACRMGGTNLTAKSTPPQPSPAPAVQGRGRSTLSPPFGAAKGRVGRGALALE